LQFQENPALRGTIPRVWILQSPHSGDNTQLRALGEALGWPAEVKRLSYRRHEGVLRPFSLPTLAGVDAARSSPLSPPWPDLVICSGRGAEAVAFWLRRQKPELRVVFVGSPWSRLGAFDLVITTPQYRLPEAPNVLHMALPLHDATSGKLAAEARRWEPRFAHLPRPYTAVLVGGSSGPYVFIGRAAERLGRGVTDLVQAAGGSLLVTTSARTGKAAAAALSGALGAPHFLYRWQGASDDNPFHAFLGLSERIVVTADSISMLAEATAAGKPVLLFDIEDGRYSMRAEEAGGEASPPPIHWRGRTLDATVFRWLINHAPARFSRDLRIVHRQLIASGRASWLGEEGAARTPPPAEDGLGLAVARIRGLFGL
jgi:mitochondrial fission protein ELM1